MRIKTTDFAEIEIDEANIIHFPEGIFAFETIKDYVLLNYDFTQAESPIMCLQSVSGEVSFTVVDPFCFLPSYAPSISQKDRETLACTTSEQLRFLAIAVVNEKLVGSVINLKSPIAINPVNQRAMQVILENEQYPLRYPLFAQDEDVS